MAAKDVYAANTNAFDSYVSDNWGTSCCYAMLFTAPSDQDPTCINLLLGFPDNFSGVPQDLWDDLNKPVRGFRVRLFRFSAATLTTPPHAFAPHVLYIKSSLGNNPVAIPTSANGACAAKIITALES